jgi:hypothetical protein
MYAVIKAREPDVSTSIGSVSSLIIPPDRRISPGREIFGMLDCRQSRDTGE